MKIIRDEGDKSEIYRIFWTKEGTLLAYVYRTWINTPWPKTPELMGQPCLDPQAEGERRYGRYEVTFQKTDWVRMPKEQFPPEFLMQILLLDLDRPL